MSIPRFMAPTQNVRARDQQRVLESVQNTPFVFSAAGPPVASPIPTRKSLTAGANGSGAQHARAARAAPAPAAPGVDGTSVRSSPAACSPTAKHDAGHSDGKRRCFRSSSDAAHILALAPAPTNECSELFQAIGGLRAQLFELERQREAPAAMLARLRAEARDLQLRIESERERQACDAPSTRMEGASLDATPRPNSLFEAAALASVTGAELNVCVDFVGVDGAAYDMDRDEADNEDDHALSLPDSFDGGEAVGDEGAWTPRAVDGSGFHFV
jgi:hypothetical protein